MKTNKRIAELDVATRAQVVSLRRAGLSVIKIAERLGLTQPSELNAVSAICAEPALRRYAVGIEVGSPTCSGRIRTGNWA